MVDAFFVIKKQSIMKHFITTALLAMSFAGVQAQGFKNIETRGGDGVYEELHIIPQEFSYNKQTSIYAVRNEKNYYGEYQYYYSYFFDVYDDSFNKLKTTPSMAQILTQTIITRSRSEDVPEKVNEEKRLWYENITEEYACDRARSFMGGILKTDTIGNEIYYYPSSSSRYLNFNTYQYNYPVVYCKYNKEEKILYQVDCIYKVYSGEWVESTEEYNDYVNRFPRVEYNTAQGSVDASLTQTFYNDDEKYEYLVYTIGISELSEEKDRDNDGEVDEIYIYKIPYAKGFTIMNEDGETLSSVDFDENFRLYDSYSVLINIMLINGKKYISFPGSIVSDDQEISVRAIYSIDSNNSGIRKVMTTKGLRVSPTIADRSQTITVELEGDSSKSHEVRVVNAAGQTVKEAVIPAGQRSISLSASELGHGMNIVNVNGKQGGNCKIIIK